MRQEQEQSGYRPVFEPDTPGRGPGGDGLTRLPKMEVGSGLGAGEPDAGNQCQNEDPEGFLCSRLFRCLIPTTQGEARVSPRP